MKKGMFCIFRFKSLFALTLTVLLVVSFSFFMGASILQKNKEKVQVNLNAVNLTDENKDITVIVDPGHGGEDGGTASSTGVLEKDINLSISLKVNDLLCLLGYKTIMTREVDSLIYDGNPEKMRDKKVSDINNRMKLINNNPHGVFLSIHQNYFTQSKYSGAQVFYSAGHEDSEKIAALIQKSIVNSIQQNNKRKIKQSGKEIYLLYHATTPAVMVECGFMSNPGEALLLADEDYQKKMAFAIVNGVTEYIKTKEKS